MRPSLGLLVSHAWLTNDGGEAFDPTWRDSSGTKNQDCFYFGIEFPTPAVGEILMERGYYGLLDPIDDVLAAALAHAS